MSAITTRWLYGEGTTSAPAKRQVGVYSGHDVTVPRWRVRLAEFFMGVRPGELYRQERQRAYQEALSRAGALADDRAARAVAMEQHMRGCGCWHDFQITRPALVTSPAHRSAA